MIDIIEHNSIPEPNTGCWIWTGTMQSPQPYGLIYVGKDKNEYAHRISYVIYKGPISPGLEIDHICKNKCCVNPDHLEAVTHQINMQRALQKTKCKRGHLLDDDNLSTVYRSNGRTFKRCKICHQIRRMKAYRRRKLWTSEK